MPLKTTRYPLQRLLGNNGNRETWLARDGEKQVTVKSLFFGSGAQWQEMKLFERSAKTLADLNHPRIPQFCTSFWEEQPDGNYFCLVQQYIPGQSLEERVKAGQRFDAQNVIKVAEQVLEILVYLHGQAPAVIHRDLKPSNLIWGEDEQIYLIDFGAVQGEATSSTITVVGTYGYMPPEQFGGRAVPASDLYSLGAALVYLLTGSHPAELPQKNLQIQFQGLVQLPPRLERWLAKLLEPSLEKRFRSATEALDSLRILTLSRPASVNLSQRPTTTALAPDGSRIRLSSSPEKLTIMIPGRNIRLIELPEIALSLVGAGLAAFGTFSFLQMGIDLSWSWPFWAAALGGVAWQLWPLLLQTEIEIDWNKFKINHRIPGLFTQRNAGSTEILRKVVREVVWQSEREDSLGGDSTYKSTYACVFYEGTKKHIFGFGLAEIEQEWLVKQINLWLGKSH
jgi:serine/threonine protein kinase